MTDLSIVILAAGLGKRMKSQLPKPLHPIGGKPMLAHVLEKARLLNPERLIVVYGHKGELLKNAFKGEDDIIWAEQMTFAGTGDAMRYALPFCLENSNVLVLYGDTPLINEETLQALTTHCNNDQLSWLTVSLADPFGYGRIIRDHNHHMMKIIEEKEASAQEKAVCEVNSGLFAAPQQFLAKTLPLLNNNNQQGEYYLTDVATIAYQEKMTIHTVSGDSNAIRGVNDRIQLAQLEKLYQHQQSHNLMLNGVTLIDPDQVTIRGTITHGTDCTIDKNVSLEGNVILGDHVYIGIGAIIKNSTIGNNTVIHPYSIIEGSIIGEEVSVGPFARLREHTNLSNKSRVGNFVETKNTSLGEGSKANHLTYLGDATIGIEANIGAGTITCNYDGAFKHKTIIKDEAFIGSNSALVAPVTIGKNATIGAGSVITTEVPDDVLALTRASQKMIKNWTRPKKTKS